MSTLLVIGSAAVGTGVGGMLGAWYGFATDHSDFPVAAVFTTPMGALIGCFAGCVLGAALFA